MDNKISGGHTSMALHIRVIITNTTNVNNGYNYGTPTHNDYYILGNNNYTYQLQNNNNTNYGNPYQQQYYSNYVDPYQQNNFYQNYGEYANTNYNMQNNLQQNYSNNNYYTHQQLENNDANIPIHNKKLDTFVYETYAQLEKTFLKDDEKVKIKDPIDIGDKKIYAISDMEGDNEKLFKLLKHIGVIKECSDNEEHDGELILSEDEKTKKQKKVYYKLDYDNIKKLKKKGILVLVGDFVTKRESCEVSGSLLNLISKLNCGLNPKNQDASKQSMFLVLGNHDVKCYDGEGGTDEEEYYLNNGLNNDYDKAANRRGLKEYLIENLNPYLQVVVKNKKNQYVVFQHTGFPYKRDYNRIMNRVVDPKKTKEYLSGTFQGKNISKVIGKDWSNKFKKR